MKDWQKFIVGIVFTMAFTLLGIVGVSTTVSAYSLPQPEHELFASKLAYIQIAAVQGDTEAQFLLGLLYLSGRIFDEDDAGIYWLSLAAERQHEQAQQTLADLAFEGQFIERDLAVAERWYTAMSEQGNRWAKFRLGFIYAAGGPGVIRNYAKAIEQFTQVGDNASLGNVAWILATCPEAQYRDGHAAVALSLKLLENNHNDPAYLDNLAAAYAEIGDFSAAIMTQKQALDALRDSMQLTKQAEFMQRLRIYQQGQPYRETLRLP